MHERIRVLMSSALAIAFGMAIHAQAPTPAAQNPRTEPETITLTGCVERADQVTTSGTSATTVDSLSFVLTHATKGGSADARPDAVGTSGAANAAPGRMYRLDADVPTLNPHVGHKVEVSGTLAAPAATAPAATDPPSPESAPKLKITSVKMLAETCAR